MRLIKRKHPSLLNTVNGCRPTGSSDIAEMWRKHYMGLYVIDRLIEVCDIQNISPNDIESVLKQLKIAKSAGEDHIHA